MSTGVTTGNNFSPEQIIVLDLLADGVSCQDAATAVNIIPGTISRWKRNKQFTDAIVERARDKLKESLPDLYKIAVDTAKKGSATHLKIILDHLDNLEALSSKNSDYNITFTWDNNVNNPEV